MLFPKGFLGNSGNERLVARSCSSGHMTKWQIAKNLWSTGVAPRTWKECPVRHSARKIQDITFSLKKNISLCLKKLQAAIGSGYQKVSNRGSFLAQIRTCQLT
jgi:hypothetical protein